jgi:hypothetical protein
VSLDEIAQHVKCLWLERNLLATVEKESTLNIQYEIAETVFVALLH